jgi:hypothetical protein
VNKERSVKERSAKERKAKERNSKERAKKRENQAKERAAKAKERHDKEKAKKVKKEKATKKERKAKKVAERKAKRCAQIKKGAINIDRELRKAEKVKNAAKKAMKEAEAAQKNPQVAIPAKACNPGKASFNAPLKFWQKVTVGTLPAGAHNVKVELTSQKDIDLELWHYNKHKITAILAHSWSAKHPQTGKRVDRIITSMFRKKTTTWRKMAITFSGDDRTKPVQEYIKIDKLTVPITIKAFAFKKGHATVNYSWSPDPAVKAECRKNKMDEKTEKKKAKKKEKAIKKAAVEKAQAAVKKIMKKVKEMKKESKQCRK